MGRVVEVYVLLGAVVGVLIGAALATAYALSYLSAYPASMPPGVSVIPPSPPPIKACWVWATVAYFAIFTALVLIIRFT